MLELMFLLIFIYWFVDDVCLSAYIPYTPARCASSSSHRNNDFKYIYPTDLLLTHPYQYYIWTLLISKKPINDYNVLAVDYINWLIIGK